MSDQTYYVSPRVKIVAKAAQFIAGGARAVPRPDDITELWMDGKGSHIPTDVYNDAREALGLAYQIHLRPNGIVAPFSPFVLIELRDILERIIVEKMYRKQMRICLIPGDKGGCSYWRMEEPARMLREKYGEEFYIEFASDITFETLLPFDAIIVQRGLFLEHAFDIVGTFQRLKEAGKKIIYEVDDDLKTLLPTNNCFYYNSPTPASAVAWLIEMSDGIFTTTQELSEAIGFPDKTYVLPNSLDFDRVAASERGAARKDIIFILWHGGSTHQQDLNYVLKPLVRFLQNKSELQDKTGKEIILSFMGSFPTGLEKFMSKDPVRTSAGVEEEKLQRKALEWVMSGRYGIRHIGPCPTSQFHNYLAYLQPDICFAPLLDTPFNRGKSLIKFTESVAAGAAVCVSDVGPYRAIPNDCALKSRSPEQMVGHIRELVINQDKRTEYQQCGLVWARQNFDLATNICEWRGALKEIIYGNVERVPVMTTHAEQRKVVQMGGGVD